MPEFLELVPPDDALKLFLANLNLQVESEWIDLSQALGRVLSRPIHAPHPLPTFNRSSVDGYAVRAEDTYGASDGFPVYLMVSGEVKMGTTANMPLQPCYCTLIHTGGMLPPGADAVVMVEHTQSARQNEIEVYRPVANGENVLKEGEDVASGQEIIAAGAVLRPEEIGGLAAFGITQLEVARQPRVAIISSGDEIVPIEQDIQPGQVRDVNTSTLKALITMHGGDPVPYGILPDQLEGLARAASQALQDCDMLVFTAGSSASVRDLTAEVIKRLGAPGVLVHGVNVRPGKPTILAACAPAGSAFPKPVIGLPGNPVSALVIARLFVVPVLRLFQGLPARALQPTLSARLALNVPSQAGREDWVPVKLSGDQAGWIAEPVFGKSNYIVSLIRADGLVRIPPSANGLSAGASVEVILL